MYAGLAPIVVHPGIHLGAYGSDETPEERTAGMETSMDLLRFVARSPRGTLWVIYNLNSKGTIAEMAEYERVRQQDNRLPSIEVRTWEEWLALIPEHLVDQVREAHSNA